jgi:predicted acylesterase/phospholipase RssA
VARIRGATKVIAVDVSINAHAYYQHLKTKKMSRMKKKKEQREKIFDTIMDVGAVPGRLKAALRERLMPEGDPAVIPNMFDIIFQTIYVMESEIVKAKLKEFPADYVIQPDIHNVSATDFERAEEIVALGERAGATAVPHIKKILGM